jgi:transcriptional regulator with XRE-family HTH domain
MARNAKELFAELPKARRKAILDRADELIAEEMTLIELRKAILGTQAKLGKKMGIKQAAVSRRERRSDMRVSTLKQIIDGLGGKVRIIAQFANRPAISVSLFDALDTAQKTAVAKPAMRRSAASAREPSIALTGRNSKARTTTKAKVGKTSAK